MAVLFSFFLQLLKVFSSIFICMVFNDCVFVYNSLMSFPCESLPLWSPNLRVFHVELGVAIGVCVGFALGV